MAPSQPRSGPVTSMRLVLFLTALAISGAVSAVPAAACPDGVYRSPNGNLVALTTPLPPAAPRQRFTGLSGDQGEMGGADAPVVCQDGAVRDHAGAAWTPVAFRTTPTDFAGPRGARLHGLLLEPENAGPTTPLVVLVHGSEKTSPILRASQLMLAGQGVSVFAYDKRGTGGSSGVYTQDFDLLADDAAAAAQEARRLAAGRFGRLGLEGGSQGGWVAPAAALKAHADFVEVAFGVAGTPLEQDQWQVDYQLKDMGFPESILPKVHAVTDATAEVARSDFSAHFDGLDRVRKAYGGEAWFSKIDGQYSGELLAGKIAQAKDESPQVPWDYPALAILRRLTIPQTWILASEDSVAPSAPTVSRLQALRREGAKIDIVLFPHADHGIRLFAVGRDGKRTNYAVADGYFRLLADVAKGESHPPYGQSVSGD